MLVYYNEQDKWSTKIENVFVYSITSSSCLVSLIASISLLFSIVRSCIRKRSVKIEVQGYNKNKTIQNIVKHQEEYSKKDIFDADFDHSRNNVSSGVETPCKTQPNLAINFYDSSSP